MATFLTFWELGRNELANQDKRRPIVRMGVVLPKLAHSCLQGERLVRVFSQPFVEGFHELRSTFVVHVPEAGQNRLGAGIEQSTHQPDQLVSPLDRIKTGAAAAQGYQLR